MRAGMLDRTYSYTIRLGAARDVSQLGAEAAQGTVNAGVSENDVCCSAVPELMSKSMWACS